MQSDCGNSHAGQLLHDGKHVGGREKKANGLGSLSTVYRADIALITACINLSALPSRASRASQIPCPASCQ